MNPSCEGDPACSGAGGGEAVALALVFSLATPPGYFAPCRDLAPGRWTSDMGGFNHCLL